MHWSFWSDPLWKVLRILSFVSSTITLIFVAVFVFGNRSWRDALGAVIVINVAVMVVLVIRTFILRQRQRHSPLS